MKTTMITIYLLDKGFMIHVFVLKYFLGDIMGCGILFPPNYDSEADSNLSSDENSSPYFLSNEDHNDLNLSRY